MRRSESKPRFGVRVGLAHRLRKVVAAIRLLLDGITGANTDPREIQFGLKLLF